jgi:hypothetical protein
MKYDQIQPKLRESKDATIRTIGKYGCYLLCLFQIAKLYLEDDIHEEVLKDLYDRYLSKKWIDSECTIIDGPAILSNLAGYQWKVEKTDIPAMPTNPYGSNTEIIYCYRAFSGDGYHFKTAHCDTETERDRLLAGLRIYTRMG